MKILEIELQTNNLQQTERFYSDVLELKISSRSSDTIEFLVGESTLRFRESLNTSSKYHFAFNIPNNKLAESIEWISPKVEMILNSKDLMITHFDNWNAESIYFYDNNKNILEFISRFDLDNSSKGSFNSDMILSISEMGVVAEKPLLKAEELHKKENLNYFKKGPKREDFVALGDENGLIVISNPDRNWYPTNDLAVKSFVKLILSENNSVKPLVF